MQIHISAPQNNCLLLAVFSNNQKFILIVYISKAAVTTIAPLTLLIYIMLRSVFLIGYVPSASMEPTLHEGSFILGLRLYSEPKVGDIIIFEKDGVLLVKRIAACPGDSVDLSQLEYMMSTPIPVWEEAVLTVPDGCYFVLGDNAQNSWDSRYWEQPYVPSQQIVAKLINSFYHCSDK